MSTVAPDVDARTRPSLLVVDDDVHIRRAVERTLSSQGYRVLGAGDGDEALEILGGREVDVALIDLDLPGMHGIELLRQARLHWPTTECIVLTGQGDVSTAYACLDAGASDYFEKPIRDWQRFHQVLRRAAEVRHLKRETRRLQDRAPSPLIGNSAAMERVRTMLGSVADSSAAILIVGESGVGKELVAEAIHDASGRRGEFVRINCASMPHDLIESELFGWEKGAHSMATHPKPGLFEVADSGTVLLDEIGELPVDLQAKLLRVLESRRSRRLGGTREKEMNARVLAATNADLTQAIDAGRFRRDLYYRLNVVTIHVPPLRERREDIPLLTYHFVKQFNDSEGRQVRHVPPQVLATLEEADWPGNVRELRNVLHRAVLLSPGDELLADALGPSVGRAREPEGAQEALLPELEGSEDLLERSFAEAKREVVDRFSRAYLRRTLALAGGNITRAAEMAGVLRPNFKRLMKQFGVEVPRGND